MPALKQSLLFALILFTSAFIGLTAEPEQSSLPDIGDPMSKVLSSQEEYNLGQELLVELRGNLPVVEDVELNYYLTNLGTRLLTASHSNTYPYPFTFLILDSPAINAFATLGGIIVLHTGLIEAAKTESELAAVISHEIAHVTQRHIARFFQKSHQLNIGTTLAILAAIIASAESAVAGQAALYAGLAANTSNQLSFSRTHELEADRIGRHTLARASYNTGAIGDFFERLRVSTNSEHSAAIEYLRTHPLPISRIADQFQLSKKKQQTYKDSLEFKLFKARAKGLSQTSTTDTDNTEPKDSLIYSRTVALIQDNRSTEALKLSKSLSKDWQKTIHVKRLQGIALSRNQQHRDAIKILKALNQTLPGHPAIIESLASAYLANDEAKKAYHLLDSHIIDIENWLPLLKLKAAATNKSGRKALSHQTMATYYAKKGRLNAALAQIEIAEKLPNTSTAIKARLEQLKQTIEKTKKH